MVLKDGVTVTGTRSRITSATTSPATKVPREVVFIDELPRNPTGKILKRELRQIEVQ